MRMWRYLAAFFAGAFIVLLIYRTDFYHISGLADSADVEAGQVQQPLPDSKATDLESSSVVTAPGSIDDTRSETAEVDHRHASLAEENVATTRTQIDEDAMRKRTRESATLEIRDSYTLLFDDIGLSPDEQDELFAFLVEARIAGMWTPYQDGKTMDPDERSNRIAALIGYTRLQQFLALERNVASYAEVGHIETMLARKGAPITETQRDELFQMLVGTRHGLSIPPDVESGSIESLEYRVAQLDERERHVIELAPSVLSPQQVVYLHARYQDCSYKRASFLDRLSRDRAKDPNKKPFLAYPACMP